MTNAPFFDSLTFMLGIGLCTTRLAAALLIMPVFAPDTVPALIRSTAFLALGMISWLWQAPDLSLAKLTFSDWIGLYAKEAFVGAVIGFFFGSFLWAMQAAGHMIDVTAGMSVVQVMDPLSGNQSSLTANFLGRFALFVFLFAGGLTFLVGLLFESYAVWPMLSKWPKLLPGLELFELEFGRLLLLAGLFAAPTLCVLYATDLGLGLLNRSAQQLNVFTLGTAFKTWLSVFMSLLMLGLIAQHVLAEIDRQRGMVLEVLRRLMAS